ncbi:MULTISPECIES: YgiQ family radical SAM protein [Shewanella]|uniref:YgiQ family radical SAM protein n=1 Tax=Shewanella fidelis TaxID=173509 RepID=A0AAW8NT30_9GAMM|nr:MULTISPECIES: YgiQ family radical SAM protein [Shewanella]MDR8526117.1 YgiQ family radical SAM protein [Shewanella fidelis]MDW4813730.1 YgiQ family radical SAM protein [Shewanella fidelis]MDW4817826.1 YgiQ family radical SAM protein [Shewanella fidelis]MDW4821913.1 YgiQ family radical SAM protein [Shewanella fidelis]MDW4826058.1 YgiQ family radical SAM protein [Shewanella fidelis]
MQVESTLFTYPKYRPELTRPAPFLPMSRKEMAKLGWDSCDIIIVTGDAYVDHPSFGMAVIGRMLEAQGFRVGIISQPDWSNKDDFMKLGKPNLYFGVTAGNMDSMINRYTAERRLRHDDAYTAGNVGGKRPDRAVTVYTQRCKEAFKQVPVVIGGIEASLRRIAHYDYWSDKVRRSVILDAKADILVYGNAERPLVELSHRLAAGEPVSELHDIRGTTVIRKEPLPEWKGMDSRKIDQLHKIDPIPNPYGADDVGCKNLSGPTDEKIFDNDAPKAISVQPARPKPWEKTYVLLPSYEKVSEDKYLYAHASRILHQEQNPGCARALFQKHAERAIWVNPPAWPLNTDEMDGVFDLAYQRVPHPSYGKEKIPAYDMIKTSINIMRGCFGGCSFCSITEHEGRIIQSRSQDSIVKEIKDIQDKVPGFTGVISDLGGPTANMYRLGCTSVKAESTCRRLSCVFPSICGHLDTDHQATIDLYRAARDVPGIKKVLIASGVRYDLATEDPRYVKELATHHVGGYLKIAPEHTEEGPLNKMMKPGMGTYDKFKELFDKYSKEAGKKQYLIPYFISAHPGTTNEDMVNLALWLKGEKFKLDQVQNFYPSPMANATTIYHTELNSLKNVKHTSEEVSVPKKGRQRKLHKALLRYHDAEGWPLIREALIAMGKEHLIGNGAHCLVPAETRQEREAMRNKKKLNTKDDAKGKKAFTRFSGDQFDDRKAGAKSGKNKSGANKQGQSKSGQAKFGQGKSNQTGKRPAKKNAWGTTPKHQR